MKDPVNLLTNHRLQQLCIQNSEIYKKQKEVSDDRFCFELIRRAVFNIEDASNLVYDIYHAWLLRKLIALNKQHTPDMDDLAQEAFVKFFTYVTPKSWSKFPSLSYVLAYLGKCSESVLFAYWRQMAQQKKVIEAFPDDDDLAGDNDQNRPMEDSIAQNQLRYQLWECVVQNCHDAKDRFLAQQLWQYGRKPQEVADRFPNLFPQMVEIYKRKRNLVERMKNDSRYNLLNMAFA
ncbi:MAG: hypothetical protein KJ069_21455 [Anaerolineae bacterium]|nr:hypothetical protein [Anaerolineae bacterium]